MPTNALQTQAAEPKKFGRTAEINSAFFPIFKILLPNQVLFSVS